MASTHVKEITESNFESEVLGSDKPVVIDFWAPWCGPCRAIAPLVDQLAGQYEGKVVVGKVNIDNNPNLAARYKITSIPAIVAFKDGNVHDSIVGANPKRINEMFGEIGR